VQLGGATLLAIYAFGTTYVVFKAVNAWRSMRVSKEVELQGLDVPEFGMLGYPEDAVQMLSAGSQSPQRAV
jgi:Amt family ammonium transporter